MEEKNLTTSRFIYPPKDEEHRLDGYAHNDLLFEGKHFAAFNITLDNELNQKWGHLRYVVGNFAGLISKVTADMLFSEPAKFKFNNKENQKFADALVFENKLHLQNYESALANSARGDAVFKLRAGKRYPNDDHDSLIIEDTSPYVYFPRLNSNNIRQKPEVEELAWIIKQGSNDFVRKEIHYPGTIENQLWSYNSSSKKLIAKIPWNEDAMGMPEFVETKVSRNLIVHIPNWRVGTRYYGYSDYDDLHQLFFALNNRMTKIDGILDKHSDPILAVPEGILDEEGKVRAEHIKVFEVSSNNEGGIDKPEYIVWNANLESAFSEVDKIVDMMFMFSEISPATMGMDKDGAPASGRALKLKLLRTIAKVRRKQLYYDQGLKELMTLAQELAKAWNLKAYGSDGMAVSAPSKIETPEIEFSDGMINDTREMAEEEEIRLRSGTTTQSDAIMRLDEVDEATAKKKVKQITEEQGVDLPLATAADPNDPKNVPVPPPMPKPDTIPVPAPTGG